MILAEEIITRRRVLRDEDDVVDIPVSTTTAGYPVAVLAQVVYFVFAVIEALLALRFVLQLLGANRGSAFVDVTYDMTNPLVAPFFGVFQSTPAFGAARVELESLLAIVVYAIVAYLVAGLLRIIR